MEVIFNASVNSSINSRSALVPFPCVQLVRISTIFCDPIRQGTNLRHVSKRLDVVQRGGLVKDAVRHREWRLVARLRAVALDGLDQRALFTANVTTRAHEHFQIKRSFRSQDVWPQQTLRITPIDF